jgi:hypothetical protein
MLIELHTWSFLEISFFRRVQQSKYLGSTVTNQNSIQEEMKSNLKSGSSCYHSVQNILCSSVLSKNANIEINRIIILPVYCTVVKIGRSHWGRNVDWRCLRMVCWGQSLGLGGRGKLGSGDIYIMRSLMICILHLIFLEWSPREK